MQPQEKTVIGKVLDVFRKRTRMEADFLYEKTGTGLYGEGVVRFAHEDKEWDLAEKGFVPPLLIYADLVAIGDVRATEAAEIIYDKYIARLVRKDR